MKAELFPVLFGDDRNRANASASQPSRSGDGLFIGFMLRDHFANSRCALIIVRVLLWFGKEVIPPEDALVRMNQNQSLHVYPLRDSLTTRVELHYIDARMRLNAIRINSEDRR